MAKPNSRIRFALRFGGAVTDFGGTWTYFDDTIGYIEDWSGLLSEGPIGGDIIQQDWVAGALWQKGLPRTYSFDVPFTALVSKGLVEPNIWDSYIRGITLLKAFRGPQLTMRRDFYDEDGHISQRDQAIGVLVTDLAMAVGIGRVIASVAVFQNLTGYWYEPPVAASFAISDTTPSWGQAVVFTDTSSPAIPLAWQWDFGSTGTPRTATTQGPHTVTFNKAGTAGITLAAGDERASSSVTSNITVAPRYTSSFQENFNALSTVEWSAPSGFAAVNGQAVLIYGGAGVTGTKQLITNDYFNLVGSSLIIETVALAQIVPNFDTVLHALTLWDKDSAICVSFRIVAVAGVPKLQSYATVPTAMNSVTWNPVAHRWLRFSEVSNVLYWHTSPDRVTWTQLDSAAWAGVTTGELGGWDADAVKIALSIAVNATDVAKGVCNFDNINTTSAPLLAAAVSDSFSTLDTNKWIAESGVVSSGGTLAFDWDGNLQSSQRIFSTNIVSLVGSSVSMKIAYVDPVVRPFNYNVLQLYTDDLSNYISFNLNYLSGTLKIGAFSSTYGSVGSSFNYSTTFHSWIRISESAGTITWETSTNGTTWTRLTSIAASALTGWTASAVRIGAARSSATGTNPTTLRVLQLDNLNL